MKPLLSLFIILLVSSESFAQQKEIKKFAEMDLIQLLTQPESILRMYEKTIEIKNTNKAYVSVRKERTILDKDARDHGFLTIYYDKFEKVKSIKGWVYDSNGKLVKKLKKDNIGDFSATSSYSLYDDNRVKVVQLYHDQMPYTVVYEYEIEMNTLLNLGRWIPQIDEDEFVEESFLNVSHPVGMELKIKEVNYTGDYEKTEVNQTVYHDWSIKSLFPKEIESLSKPANWDMPMIYLATDKFNVDGYAGSQDSWQNFGKWYGKLSVGRSTLSDQTKSEIDSLISGVELSSEKAKLIYHYMQDKTRYISIQLGIGGWQPFPASYVENTGYGDCKALTNYTYSLLRYAGIESYPVLIRSGNNRFPIQDDFPMNQFNHVVLMVPTESDTLWLESTSQILPFNYISSRNSNRKALKISPEGGMLVDTPEYDENKNTKANKIDLMVLKDGSAIIDFRSTLNGLYLEDVLFNTANLSEKKKIEWLYDSNSLNTFSVTKYDLSEVEERVYPMNISYTMETPSFATDMGSRLFVPVNALNFDRYNIDSDTSRTKPVFLPYEFTNIDTLVYQYPDEYYVEALPNGTHINHEFGFYSLEVDVIAEERKIHIIRTLQIAEQELEADQYMVLKEFFDEVRGFDNQEFVLNRES